MKSNKSEKPTVLLVHGMWGTQDTLSEVEASFLDQGYKTEALCLPYHVSKEEHTAESKAKLAQVRLQDYVEYVVESVRQQSSPPILVGHSMGALLAQLAAAQVPCHRLILMSSAAPSSISGMYTSAIRTFGRNVLRFPLWKSITEVHFKNVRYGVANSQSTVLQHEIYMDSTYESGMVTLQISMGLLLGRRAASYVDTKNIQCPVLVIGGTADRITPMAIQRKIAKSFAGHARLLEIGGCCHWTVGGTFFPTIRTEIFKWVEE